MVFIYVLYMFYICFIYVIYIVLYICFVFRKSKKLKMQHGSLCQIKKTIKMSQTFLKRTLRLLKNLELIEVCLYFLIHVYIYHICLYIYLYTMYISYVYVYIYVIYMVYICLYVDFTIVFLESPSQLAMLR